MIYCHFGPQIPVLVYVSVVLKAPRNLFERFLFRVGMAISWPSPNEAKNIDRESQLSLTFPNNQNMILISTKQLNSRDQTHVPITSG